MTKTQERLSKVEMHLENRNKYKEEPDPNRNEREEERGPLTPYQGEISKTLMTNNGKVSNSMFSLFTVVWILNSS